MSIFDEFKQELRERLRIVGKQLPHTVYEFRYMHDDGLRAALLDVAKSDWTDLPIDDLVVPVGVGVEECIALAQALDWIESMEDHSGE